MKKIIRMLKKNYPDAQCQLNFLSPHQLLVATILSAQCTDKMVNRVTPELFRKLKDIKAFAEVSVEHLGEWIRPCGYFNQKARMIVGASRMILEKFHSVVPRTLEELTLLPGVGRKTANCVLATAYQLPAVVIDTHMIRIMNLLQFVHTKDAVKIEYALMDITSQKDWIGLSNMIIEHGRKVCIARRPKCGECALNKICPSTLL